MLPARRPLERGHTQRVFDRSSRVSPGPDGKYDLRRGASIPWLPLPHMEEFILEVENLTTSGNAERTYIGLARFAGFLHNEYPEVKQVDQIKRIYLLEFFDRMINEYGLKAATLYNAQVRIRSWLKWLVDLGYLEKSPWIRIKSVHSVKKPNPVPEEDLEAMFATHRRDALRLEPFIYHRRDVILVFLYGLGLRITELERIDMDDIAAAEKSGVIVTYNKGYKTKTLPYPDFIRDAVRRYLPHRARYVGPNSQNALLLTTHKTRLDTGGIRYPIDQLGIAAGVDINPHRLRDTYGTQLLNNGMALEQVMKLMGHATTTQTLTYAQVEDRTLVKSYESAMNPRMRRLSGAIYTNDDVGF
jgi:site-specific recombinase XerD